VEFCERRDAFDEVDVRPLVWTAPLVEVDALGAVFPAEAEPGALPPGVSAAAGAPAVAGAGVTGAAVPPATTGEPEAGGVGGAAGVAGVPKPDGVHAQASPEEIAAMLSSDTTVKLILRVRNDTGTSPRVKSIYMTAALCCLPQGGADCNPSCAPPCESPTPGRCDARRAAAPAARRTHYAAAP